MLGDREIEVGDNSFAWSQRTEAGLVRYTTQVTDDNAWHEAGHLTREVRTALLDHRVSCQENIDRTLTTTRRCQVDRVSMTIRPHGLTHQPLG